MLIVSSKGIIKPYKKEKQVELKLFSYLYSILGFTTFGTALLVSFGDIKSVMLAAVGFIYMMQKVYSAFQTSQKKKLDNEKGRLENERMKLENEHYRRMHNGRKRINPAEIDEQLDDADKGH